MVQKTSGERLGGVRDSEGFFVYLYMGGRIAGPSIDDFRASRTWSTGPCVALKDTKKDQTEQSGEYEEHQISAYDFLCACSCGFEGT